MQDGNRCLQEKKKKKDKKKERCGTPGLEPKNLQKLHE